MNTEDVANVLRECGAHVRLIVARSVEDVPESSANFPFSVVVLGRTLHEEFVRVRAELANRVSSKEVAMESRAPVLRDDVVSRRVFLSN